MAPDVYEYTAYGVGDIACLLLWGAAVLGCFAFAMVNAFRLAVLVTSALMDIEEDKR